MTHEGAETRLLLLTLEPKTLADAERMERGLQQPGFGCEFRL